MKANILAIVLAALAASPAAAQIDAAYEAAIRDTTYGQIIDTENIATIVPYYRGVADYCIGQAGADPLLAEDLDAIAARLDPIDPDTANQLFQAGAEGLLTDPSGAVPTASIAEVAVIKAMDKAGLCADLAAVIRGQLHSLATDCAVNETATGFDCPASRQLFLIGPDG